MDPYQLKTVSMKWRRLQKKAFSFSLPLGKYMVLQKKTGPVYDKIRRPHEMRKAFHHFKEWRRHH